MDFQSPRHLHPGKSSPDSASVADDPGGWPAARSPSCFSSVWKRAARHVVCPERRKDF